ncbi:MAG TPA: 30S ribosomal protein S1 [Thermodesulfovibrionales bacterium]|nr:30S ribosomal protein S1 [Thermodesulfovibrionales bacterium]
MERENNEMERIYAETFRQIREGSILAGRVIAVKQDGVIVDIGYKSDGFIPAEEFSPEEFSALMPGDMIDVYVVNMHDTDGIIILSKDTASKIKTWDVLESAYEKGTKVQGAIRGKTKGGLTVEIMGVKAFLPSSQIDSKTVKDPDSLIGRMMDFKVLKVNNKRSNIIVSRRAAIEEERQKKKIETLPKLKEGALLEGVVKNITDYGVFVDLGGIDGLLHISDISWGRITHPSEFFAVGETIEVIILKYDEGQERVTLGYKQKMADPWLTVAEKYPVGKRLQGKVVSIADYGAFIELEEGVEGLVHVSEIDWSPRPKHPSKYLSIGETVEAVVIKADREERRLSLSIKQLKQSPWEIVSQQYAVGQKVSGKIRSITEFGVFVGLPEGVDGLIHISDISWTKHIKHPSEVLKKGQKIDAVILSLEPEKERISLGLKQLSPDPWIAEIPERFKLGDEVRCRILKLTDFGIFVEIEGGVEGLIYSSEVVKGEEPFQEGEEVMSRIIKIDTEERKIGLSMKHVKGEKA